MSILLFVAWLAKLLIMAICQIFSTSEVGFVAGRNFFLPTLREANQYSRCQGKVSRAGFGLPARRDETKNFRTRNFLLSGFFPALRDKRQKVTRSGDVLGEASESSGLYSISELIC
jgi:hypothetical protein